MLDPASEPCHELPGVGDGVKWGICGTVGRSADSAAAHSRDLFCCVNRMEATPLSEEELSELPECVLCE